MRDLPPPRPRGNRIDAVPHNAPELAGHGAFAVGVTTLRLTNRDQIDVAASARGPLRLADRDLVTELWYPAVSGAAPNRDSASRYRTELRDGDTSVWLHGLACRDAGWASDGPFPLVVLSHGHPGNRFLMAHLAEALASRGYVVAAVDHLGSTYCDHQNFGATLVHRPTDQRFVIDALADPKAGYADRIDTETVGVIGYSMGAYGALIFGGAGLSEAAMTYAKTTRRALLVRHAAGSATLDALVDPRVKAIVPIGIWGAQHDFWRPEALAAMTKPCLLIGGSADEISGYAAGIRRVFSGLTGCDRHLLTFVGAAHNAAAPIPAPEESWAPSPGLNFLPADHYADPVWDTIWMNAVAQHFSAAFLGLHLKQQTALATYLDADFAGFRAGTDIGLQFETLPAGHQT